MGSITDTDTIHKKRTYHTTGSAYSLPNDNVEHQRLEIQHALFIGLMGGRIIHAPLTPAVSKAIDIGCGTGSVTHAIASAHPSTTVYGIDLSAVPARMRTKLPNLSYIQGDFNELASQENPDPRFTPKSFDYAFSRMLIYGITNWQAYVDRAVSLVKPGGWIEMQEADYHWYRVPRSESELPPSETFASHDLSMKELQARSHLSEAYLCESQWQHTMSSLLRAKSLNPHAGSALASHMAAAGLTDIRIRRYISPSGVWPGLTREAAAFGNYVGKQTPLMYVPTIRKLGEETGWDSGVVEEAVQYLEKEFEGEDAEEYRLWFWVYVVCGRKPE
ncbi:S-adenosyl-L-methionine-dependent methyltransferase [Zopfia rhizophila CBS 207.26]|uniref:S-adenosyl-L-methionine-dependent methyltransferase n=1 Tax=Zopfia rhizophila CBS 207.26 TaxID=1314779 RepID=A0A6A6EZB0_9PEZI|nr:S-adenosyl-L-methionine-dependent methyltransferase [Zopfia rhizophila CBS 207.26]